MTVDSKTGWQDGIFVGGRGGTAGVVSRAGDSVACL